MAEETKAKKAPKAEAGEATAEKPAPKAATKNKKAAAEGQGVSVVAVRTGAIVLGSALMGVAGSFLTLSAFNAFFFNMVNGRGWICVALVVFASWRPGKALLGALLFAFFDALQLRLQQSGAAVLPYQMYLMLPYVLSILALVLVARRASYPQALMKPYRKGER
jgi:simple sugar transport system permease protein